MAFRIRNVTPYGPVAGFQWIRHLSFGWKRSLLGEAPDKYLNRLIQYGFPAFAVEGFRKNCSICGYAQVRLKLDNGLNAQGCSMTEIPQLLASEKFPAWADQVARKSPIIETAALHK
jgi:hypothetical protein